MGRGGVGWEEGRGVWGRKGRGLEVRKGRKVKKTSRVCGLRE